MFSFYLVTRREKTGFELPNWFYWGFIVAAGIAALRTGSRGGLVSLAVAILLLLVGTWRSRDPAAKVVWKIIFKSRLALAVCVAVVAVLVPRFVARSTIARVAEGTGASTFDSAGADVEIRLGGVEGKAYLRRWHRLFHHDSAKAR